MSLSSVESLLETINRTAHDINNEFLGGLRWGSFFCNKVDFKRNESGITRIYEYTPPPPISVLAPALL